jgi:hypothetical protein
MIVLLSLPVAAGILIGLRALARKRLAHAWLAAAIMSFTSIGLAVVVDPRPSETSTVAFVIGAIGALCIATAILLHASRRLGEGAALLVATLILGLGWIPGYIAGCIAVEWLPVNRCFF